MTQELNLTPAYIALCGVLVGSAISSGANWLLARRRERIESEREKRDHTIEVRRAARLILAEIIEAQVIAQTCIMKKWRYVPNSYINLDAWIKYKDILAAALPDDDWWSVFQSYNSITSLMNDDRADCPLGVVSDNIAQGVITILDNIKKGVTTLNPYTGHDKI